MSDSLTRTGDGESSVTCYSPSNAHRFNSNSAVLQSLKTQTKVPIMNTTHKTKPQFATRNLSTLAMLRLAVMLAILASVPLAQAATFIKADNTTALNTSGSWTTAGAPGSGDIGQWDSTLATVNNTTNTLGAGMSWSGIKIVNPAAKIQINAGSILTNGASGIDMTTATVDLALSNTVQIAAGAQQQWNVAAGRTLSL